MPYNPNADGLVIHWQCFGSNGQEKADYSRGVLERFTRRAPRDWFNPKGKGNGLANIIVKTITNPRRVVYMYNPHFVMYTDGSYSINEDNVRVQGATNRPVAAKKIVVNHYQIKSLEEYTVKLQRGAADGNSYEYADSKFKLYDYNEEFDDGILKYRDARAKIYRPPDISHTDERLLKSLIKNLSPTLLPDTPQEFYTGKMETFLTCRAVASYFKEKYPNNSAVKFLEEISLAAILNSLDKMTLGDAQLLTFDLPKILRLPYPVVRKIRNAVVSRLPEIIAKMRMRCCYREVMELDYLRELLEE